MPTISVTARPPGTVLRTDVDENAATSASGEERWAWPPYAPWEPAEGERFGTEQWAPASIVRRPWVRVGR